MSPTSESPSFLSNLSGPVLFLSRDPVKNFFSIGELFQKFLPYVSPETAKLLRHPATVPGVAFHAHRRVSFHAEWQ